jgi:site-specific recombinase XerD
VVAGFVPGHGSREPLEIGIDQLTKAALRVAFGTFANSYSKASIRRAWSSWSALFDHLVAKDLIEGNPMPAVGKPKSTRGPVKVIRGDHVVDRLFGAAATPVARSRVFWPVRDVALVAAFAATGMRLAEVTSLNTGAVDGPAGGRRLNVIGKGDKPRTLPLWPAFDRVLQTYLSERVVRFPRHRLRDPATPLFVATSGERLRDHQVQYLIERLYERAGIRDRVPKGALVHALRHTFGTTALEGGATLLEVSRLLGHESLDTTRQYVEATADELGDSVPAHPAQVALNSLPMPTPRGSHPSIPLR